MRITHRVAVGQRNPASQEFRDLGFEVDEPISVFHVSDTDPLWPAVREIIVRRQVIWDSDNEFSERELRSARALKIFCTWANGYPQPADDHIAWHARVYGTDGMCKHCMTPQVQTGSFRLRAEPKWGNRTVMGLNWSPDTLFVRPEFYKSALEPLGIKCRPVLMHRTGELLQTIVQLVHQGSVQLAHPWPPARLCPVCGRQQFEYPQGGGFAPEPEPTQWDYYRTSEYFGTGYSHPLIYTSQRLYQVLKQLRQRSLVFEPCEPHD